MLSTEFASLFHIDRLSIIMVSLVGFIGTIIAVFSMRYMAGDKRYYQFFAQLFILVLLVMVMTTADNLFLFLASWGLSNFVLVRLMIHKASWRAAYQAGKLAAYILGAGFISLILGCMLLYSLTGTASIQAILQSDVSTNPHIVYPITFITLAAMTQSSIWPFHRWLLSSLNSPTPVSAIMHAGLINGGGYLLVRFAPLYFTNSIILTSIFLLGICTALLGTLFKLLQNDIKRMLACSTMAQMGYMFAQCGLGLFPLAVSHLFWHGLFKANLFLSSPNIVKEKRAVEDTNVSFIRLIFAVLISFFATYLFTKTQREFDLQLDTRLVFLSVVLITLTQVALTCLHRISLILIVNTTIITTCSAILYGFIVRLFEVTLAPLNIFHPQPINFIHVIAMFLLAGLWIGLQFKCFYIHRFESIKAKLYVKALNASQPNSQCVTTNHNEYQYK